jgi:hypothetical protein
MRRYKIPRRFSCRSSRAWALILVILGLSLAVTQAQPAPPAANAVVYPTLQVNIPAAQVRTWADMEAAGAEQAAPPGPPRREKKYHPTVNESAYKDLKARADQDTSRQAASGGAIASSTLLAPAITNPINFDGVDSVTAGNLYPPDTHGAAGPAHFVQITNSHLDIYLKTAPNTLVKSVPLSSFFTYTAQDLFDVRVIYDAQFGRWIISADAFPETTSLQKFFFAVSQTSDPTGNFYFNFVNVSDGLGGFWDFPQLGMDQNAIIFTANFFDQADNFVDARMFAVAKSLLYSGQSFSLNLFTGLAASTAPPLVLDANPNTFLVAADVADTKVTFYTLQNSATSPALITSTIPVPAYSAPPNAPQPATTVRLDSGDSRFVNAGTQVGDSLFQVHTVNVGGFARPRFYEFDTVNRRVRQTGTFARSTTSYDFNASIAANRTKDVFVTWSATDPGSNVNAEVRFSGRRHNDPLNVIPGPGSLLFGSATFYRVDRLSTVQRWGDYSAVSLDPADLTGATAWIVNERILSPTSWGSRIGQIKAQLINSLPAVYLLLED